MDKYSALLENIIEYGNRDDKIRAIIMIGSRAQANNRADEYSDLDLILIVNDAQSFFVSDDWLLQIGVPRISFVEQTIDDAWEKRVMFDGALDVDFVIFSQEDATAAIKDGDAREMLREGYSVLIDKCGVAQYLPEIRTVIEPYAYPSGDEFINNVNDFFYHTIWFGKKLLRGELWTAKLCLDTYIKTHILWMSELYEHTRHDDDFSTRKRGRYFDTWASEETKTQLAETFAHYNKPDMTRALTATIKMYRNLATAAAVALAYTYPTTADEFATDWVVHNLA